MRNTGIIWNNNPLSNYAKRKEFMAIIDNIKNDQQLSLIMVKLWDLSKIIITFEGKNKEQ